MRVSGKPRVLIAGGAGFIGSHLCAKFLEEGYEVTCLDSFFTGSKENIKHLCQHPDFDWIRHDITEPYIGEAELILNFACPASPVHYQYDPIHTIKTSFLGTLHLLEMAKRTGATLLQASTSEVYGDPKEHPQKESYWGHVNPIGVRSCYDEGKRAAETLCYDFKRLFDLDIKVIRIFNTYGPHMAVNDGRVVSNFISQALLGKPLTIYGEGQQTRSFCYVSDLVAGIFKIARAAKELTPTPFNLGNPGEFTIKELADKVLKKTGSRSPLISLPLPQDDPQCRRPDLSRTSETFAWHPCVSLEEGLDKTIPYFQRMLGSPIM